MFDPDQVALRPPTLWRYREAIPVKPLVTMGEGFTPLLELRNVFIKNDTMFPTGSFKDRGAAVLISYCKQQGITSVVEDSSGNAGCAIAAYCAAGDIGCEIFVPASTSPDKLKQIERYGAKLTLVPGSRADTAAAAELAGESTFYASHVHQDHFLHGTKTWAFEVVEQLGWSCPDVVVLPVGNGSLLLGVHMGFSEMLDAGLIDRMPRLIGVKAENPSKTIAHGIGIVNPPRAEEIATAVDEMMTVSDDQIIQAMHALARCGHDVEPTGAVGYAGVLTLDVHARVVTSLTGRSLKSLVRL
jgi:threonine synthase